MTYSSPHDMPHYSDPDYDISGHPFPTDYEDNCAPDDPIYCDVCGDEPVDEQGAVCVFCASPEQVAERAEFDAWMAVQAEAKSVMAAMHDAITISPNELMYLAEMTDRMHDLEAA